MKKRLQKFKSFKLNEGMIDNDKYFLLSNSYINEFDDPKKGLSINHVTLKTWVEDLKNPKSVDELSYSSLFRYLIYFWFYSVAKNSSQKGITEIREKLMVNDEETEQTIEKIIRNRVIFNSITSKHLKSSDINTTDSTSLTNFIERKSYVFTQENVLKMFDIINMTNKPDDLNNFINNNDIFDLRNAISVEEEDVELIADSSDGKKKIHIISLTPGTIIEEPGTTKYNTLKIKNSSNEITPFNKWEDESLQLPYDILLLNDVENQKTYYIDSKYINKIFTFNNSNDIMINMKYRKSPKIFNTKS